MDKLIEKLSEILAKLGLDEDAINGVIAELSDVAKEEAVEEDSAKDGDPTETTQDEAVPPLPPEEVVNEAPTEELNSDVPADEVPPVEGEVPPESEQVPPVEPPAPQVPPFDPTELINQVNDLGAKLEEQVKANEGLLARIGSLEEALKGAGVIDGESTASEVGDPNPSTAPGNPTEDVFQDVLNDLNGRKRF